MKAVAMKTVVKESEKKMIVVDLSEIEDVGVVFTKRRPYAELIDGGEFLDDKRNIKGITVNCEVGLEVVDPESWCFGRHGERKLLKYKKDLLPGDIVAGTIVSYNTWFVNYK